jgi:hypothetical protein
MIKSRKTTNADIILVGKHERKKARRRLKNNIKMYLKERGYEGVN